MDRTKFFNTIKSSLFGKFTPDQVRGLDTLLEVFSWHKLSIEEKAYMLATVYHECSGKMLPIEEYGKGKGRRYGQYVMWMGRHIKACLIFIMVVATCN